MRLKTRLGLLKLAVYILPIIPLQAQDSLIFKGTEGQLVLQTFGSGITNFSYLKQGINPLSWGVKSYQLPKNNQVGPDLRGHFLCLGRWGAPTEGEIKRGIPHNGEVNTQRWAVSKRSATSAKLSVMAPLDNYFVTREIETTSEGTSFRMTEEVENKGNTARLFNLVQHPTIGPPFLNKNTRIDCNADHGFDQRTAYNKLDEEGIRWPMAKLQEGLTDLRKVSHEHSYVTTHLISEEAPFGWISATSADQELLMGYLWRRVEYPWLNVWHYFTDGKPFAHGLEFGTTGLGQPYQLLAGERVVFRGKSQYEILDAGEKITKSFLSFIVKVPKDFQGVAHIAYEGKEEITIFEAGGKNRIIKHKVPKLPY